MADNKSRGRSQDRKKVAGAQAHETAYTAAKTGKTADQVKQAVKQVGNSRAKVERALNKGK